MLSAYARLIVRHPYLLMFTVGIISTILTVVPFVCYDIPSFTDPVAGFETRGTTLAHRFIAWENLIDETRPSRRLAVNPQEIEDQIRMNTTYYNETISDTTRSADGRRNKTKNKKSKASNSIDFIKTSYPINDISDSNGHVHWAYGKNVPYEDENAMILKSHIKNQWKALKELRREPNNPFHHNFASGACGSPISDYAHLVIESTNGMSLLSYENVKSMCTFQSVLVEIGGKEYHNMCQRYPHTETLCCPVWSVPNYIALMSGKHSCENLIVEDVSESVTILIKCAGYFHNLMMASCDMNQCKVPKYCSQYDAVYNLMFYIIDSEALPPQDNLQTFVKNAMLFFPLPRGSTVMPYYEKLQSSNLSYNSLIIPAIDFGLKNSLFDLWIIQETWLIAVGSIFVFMYVCSNTGSLKLTILLFIANTFSLGIAYFFYIYVFKLKFFPFMNLFVIVVVIGIGADDAFIYLKIWKMIIKSLTTDNVVSEYENEVRDNMSRLGEAILVQILQKTLKHSLGIVFITSLTTAVAFFASFVSYIPAINCFSVFAGTAVLANFLLMITWLPAAVFIIDVKMCKNEWKMLDVIFKNINKMWEEVGVFLTRFIITCVTKLHIMFVVVLGAIGIYSIVVVFYSPRLQFPDSKQFQLFQTSHPFEQYDMLYRDKFLFERFAKDVGVGSNMPLRWVWGIKAIDNGNHMDPSSTGKLIFQDDFTISEPESQLWLAGFCERLKAQPFYKQTNGPLLSNCFIESFKMYMSRPCLDNINRIDRTPCCAVSQFPYTKEVFDLCIIKAMKSLYQTPRELFMPGVAGPKFLRSVTPLKIVALVVEFESVVSYSMSFESMNDFYANVENWTQHEMKSAPPGMRNGWFVSDFQFYDLQNTLARGTLMALLLSAFLGFILLLLATHSFVISICSLTTMIFSSTVTVGILVLFNWKLNVLESVAISTSAGLAVDFSLHYALSYTKAVGNKKSRVRYSLTASAGPTAAAASTTGIAGIILLRSYLLPYSHIGTFLALITSVSWVFATFFLCSLLYKLGGDSSDSSSKSEIKSVSRVSSICSGVPNLESHELEHLADSNRTNITHSQSPSVSATTVVLH